MRVKEELTAMGHSNIKANHKTTLEITKENELSLRGDCIIAVSASCSLSDLSSQFKELAKSESARIILRITVDEITEEIKGWGSPQLSFESQDSMVCRKSTYIDYRTLMIKADKTAANLSRELIKKIQSNKQPVKIQIIVEKQL